jgi:hypothetical protein
MALNVNFSLDILTLNSTVLSYIEKAPVIVIESVPARTQSYTLDTRTISKV